MFPPLRAALTPWPWLLALALSQAWPHVPAALANPSKVHDIPLPPRSRSQDSITYVSSRGFRRTVDFYKRFFKRTGVPHRAIPIYRYRGASIARFLSRNPRSRWLAIHIYRHRARTLIAIIPRPPPPDPPPP